jgi:hypothetical protein
MIHELFVPVNGGLEMVERKVSFSQKRARRAEGKRGYPFSPSLQRPLDKGTP